MQKQLKSTNTILYCKQWASTVRFYNDQLRLPILFATDWFVEFDLAPLCRLSIADESRSSIKSCGGQGITLALEVEDIVAFHQFCESADLQPTPIHHHPWNAEVFYLRDPEGHRIEIWQRPSRL